MNFPGSASIFHYRPACVLRVSGTDAWSFLQGQFTNDLRNLSPGRAVYGLWLDHKGRVMGDSHVVRSADGADYWVVSLSSPASAVARRLEDHVVADDVVIEDATAAWLGVSMMGQGVGAWCGQASRPGLLFPGRRCATENWEWIFGESESGDVNAAIAGAREASGDEIERARIGSAIPRVPQDIGPADLPGEGGLEEAAISYSKGCYLGQEVMARLKSRGRVRRALVRVAGAGGPPAVPAALWRGDRREGELRSVAPDPRGRGYCGLALVPVAAAAGGSFSLASGIPPSLDVVPSA
ncbi:MAG TPA: folate-binding protein [Opitutaceae bacterium]|nr:folate-binding protein [Opitutaceae bacterium]